MQTLLGISVRGLSQLSRSTRCVGGAYTMDKVVLEICGSSKEWN